MGDINGLIDKWAEDAQKELGEHSWKDLAPNCMMLIVYAAQKADSKKLGQKITKPFWWLLAIVAPGVVWYIVTGVIG